MAADYLRIKTELEQLQQSKSELQARLSAMPPEEELPQQGQAENQILEEYVQLQNEKVGLPHFFHTYCCPVKTSLGVGEI